MNSPHPQPNEGNTCKVCATDPTLCSRIHRVDTLALPLAPSEFANNHTEQVEIIGRTSEALTKFGRHYGGYPIAITREQLNQMSAGEVLAFTVNGLEYSCFVGLRDDQLPEALSNKGGSKLAGDNDANSAQ